MALVTGTGLTNPSDIIAAICTELTTNHGWIQRFTRGSVGANSLVRWIELPATLTKNNKAVIIGMAAQSTDRLSITVSNATSFSALETGFGSPFNILPSFDKSGANAFRLNSFATMNLTSPCNASGGSPGVNLLNTGANYLRHWIFTPTQVSPQRTKTQYCYFVVEASTGVFRTIGFGEVIKLGTWTGGTFCEATNHSTSGAAIGNDDNAEHSFFGDGGQSAGNTPVRAPGFITATDVSVYSPDYPYVMTGYTSQTGSREAMNAFGMGFRCFGSSLLAAPSAFSGVAQRLPARFYLARVNNVPGDSSQNLAPFAEYPDVFLVNIRDLIPGDTLIDDTEKFLVVPFTAKSGTNVSGNYGFLIKSDGL